MSNLIKHVKSEFAILGWDREDADDMQKAVCENILELVEVFSKQGHSGTSAVYVIAHLQRLLNFEPLSPLTGDDSEWNEVGEGVFQNRRDSEVFKDGKDGKAYWIQGKVFRTPSGCCYTSSESRVFIDFPWVHPKESEIVEVPE